MEKKLNISTRTSNGRRDYATDRPLGKFPLNPSHSAIADGLVNGWISHNSPFFNLLSVCLELRLDLQAVQEAVEMRL